MDLLFESEQRGVNAVDLLEQRVAAPVSESPIAPYSGELVRGVVANWHPINEALTTYSTGWTIERMPAVDRALLRIGTYEVLYNADVPDQVAVSEAVLLATELSTDASPGFVNGLLNRIVEVKSTLV